MEIKFVYRNYKDEIRERTVEPHTIIWISDPSPDAKWYYKGNYKPGWYLVAVDKDKNEIRTFALDRMTPSGQNRMLFSIAEMTGAIEMLRKDRVKLQDENDMLRNDLKKALAQVADSVDLLIKQEMEDDSRT